MTDAGQVVLEGTPYCDGPDGPDGPDGLDALTAAVRGTTGFDLTGYRGDTVLRRARARAQRLGAPGLRDYAAVLAGDGPEARALLDEVLVQRSGWFRDGTVWRLLAEQVLPPLVAAATTADRPLRAWSAGCGDGREVWSLATLLAAAVPGDWKVLASDVSERALLTTEAAVYPGAVDGAPAGLARWATAHTGGWRVAAPLRGRVTVVRHDVRDPAPREVAGGGGGGGLDLLLCRNVLMYLDEAAQRLAVEQLLTALRPGGVLVLGTAEAALDHRDVLVPVDLAARAYRLIGTPVAPVPPSAPGVGRPPPPGDGRRRAP